jgi:CSLREA domain-containing protein
MRPVSIGIAGVILFAWTAVGSSWAATIRVTTTAEDPLANSTDCSLREAIISANRHVPVGGCPAGDAAGEDSIVLQAGATYELTQPDMPQIGFTDRASWYGPNGLPPIASRILIEGNGATISRSPFSSSPFRLFFVGAGPGSPNPAFTAPPPGPGALTLRDVTLEDGYAKGGDSNYGGGGAGLGGAIFSQGTVSIERSTLTGNTAQGGSANDASAGAGGGGIGTDSSSGESGGGFGPGTFGGAFGGAGASSGGGSGGGAGFGTTENGSPGVGANGGNGGGPQTGLAGAGGGTLSGTPGSGGDGGGGGGEGFGEVYGGAFGYGGRTGGGGGGVGGGGGGNGAFGGGGFGGGGGSFGGGLAGGSAGGFGGGAGAGSTGGPGFGGGTPTSSEGGGGAGMGGAIFNMQGRLTIADSTLTGNTASGGFDVVPDPGKGIAGAVFNLNGSFTATGSTFAGNRAPYYASQIFNLVADEATARTAQTTLTDTIVANGIGGANPSVPPDFATSDVTSDQTNYPGPNKTGASATVDESGFDLVTASHQMELGTLTGTPLTSDPLLGPLANQGGPTQTMAPQPGSPVIDAGAAFGLATDQRGMPRPRDFSGVSNAPGGDGSDIGAVEVQPACNGQSSPSQTCGGLVISNVHESHRVWVEGSAPAHISRKPKHPLGTVFNFTLNEAASVRFVFVRAAAGRKVGKKCVAPTKVNRHRHRCTRLAPAGAMTFTGRVGDNKLAFQGRLSRTRKLKLGSYTLAITATDAAGHSSTSPSLRFTIVKR